MGLLDISSVFTGQDSPENLKKKLIIHKKMITQLEQKLLEKNIETEEVDRFYKEQKKINIDLQKKLTIDTKTGLPNRMKMTQDINDYLDITKYQEEGKFVSLLIIQLDKNYNVLTKTLRPALCEWVLYKLGMRINQLVDTNGLYHTREDEFIVILKDIKNNNEIINFTEELSSLIREKENISGYHITIGANIGISTFPDNGITKEQLLTAADIALEHAKDRRVDYLFFKNEFKQRAMEKLELQNYIIKALEKNAMEEMNNQFEMFYQPIIKAAEGKDGRLLIKDISAEALIRWNHPEKGLVPPDRFIPLAEETGIIVLLGNWIMYNVADKIQEWKEKLGYTIPVSINVSSLQFHEGNLVDFVRRILETRDISPGTIKLELTETSLMADPIDASRKIEKLKNSGVKICIDDFGTGYSSFNYLRQFAIDLLKIDKSFVESVFHNACDQAIVRAIITMSSELNFDVVVEGVEDINQFNFLFNEGCRNYQGYLFSKPLPAAMFIDYYRNNINTPIIS